MINTENDGIPECIDYHGHKWVSGRAELTDEELVHIVSKQCRRCGYETDINREAATDKNQNSESE